jgi:hypothetical protein
MKFVDHYLEYLTLLKIDESLNYGWIKGMGYKNMLISSI